MPLLESPDLILVEGTHDYDLEEIIESRKVHNSVQYCVTWKGFKAYDNSWVLVRGFNNCTDLVRDFHESNPSANCLSKEVMSILAIKLPKPHKNFALDFLPDGGVTPRKIGKGDLRPAFHSISLDRSLFSRHQKHKISQGPGSSQPRGPGPFLG